MTLRLGDWLESGPYTLALSAGFFGFFAHAGVLAALEEAGLQPAAVSGASAGALTGGLWASGLSAGDISSLYSGLSKRDFWDPAPGLGLLRGDRFRALLAGVTGSTTVNQVRVPLRISVFDGLAARTRTAVGWRLAEAIYASCAVPLLFQPLRRGLRLFWDGGIRDRQALHGVRGRVFVHRLPGGTPRPGITTLSVPGLPRLGPDSLRDGPRAARIARQAALAALHRPLGAFR
jgi:NTE family protein